MAGDAVWSPGDRCINASPGFACGTLWEMILLGFGFWIAGGVSAFFVYFTIRKSKARCFFQDQTILFWIFLMVWQLFRGAITLFDFPWSPVYFRLLHDTLNHILMFIPMGLVILIVFELLFTYRNPGVHAIAFFRMLIRLFLVTFLILWVLLSLLDLGGNGDAEASVSLWCACTDVSLAIFFALPAKALLEIVTFPMAQLEDIRCVNMCRVGIVLYVVLFGGRMLWNGTHYFEINVAQTWLSSNGAVIFDAAGNAVRLNGAARALMFFFVLFFDMGTSLLAMISVYLFKKHGIMFSENPYYTRNE
jgi:hypothetical protein